VYVLGAGAVAATPVDGLAALLEAVLAARPLRRGGIDSALERHVPRADSRGLDPAAIHLTSAAARALAEAGLVRGGPLRGEQRARTGLVVGTTRTSVGSAREFKRSADERGLARVSANAFARMVLNASQGTCATLLAIKGPQTTLAAGTCSGLVAVGYAASLLTTRADVDVVVAGAVEETDREAEEDRCEGAACLVLGPMEAARAGAPVLRLAGWVTAGPGALEAAVDGALAAGGVARGRVGAVFGPAAWAERPGWRAGCVRADPAGAFGRSDALGPAMACAAAVAWLQHGAVGEAAVVADAGTASCALVMVREG
jgi:hypothetical protein